MKKLLFLLPIAILTLTGCQPEPKSPLPDPDPESYQVTLNPDNSGLTSEDLEQNIECKLEIEGKTETYDIEISAPTYYSTKHEEMMLKDGSYFKSISAYHVDRLIVDFYDGQFGNFSVYSTAEGTGDAAEAHESTSESPHKSAGGKILEYAIESTGWMIKNVSNKAGFYSVTVVFSM